MTIRFMHVAEIGSLPLQVILFMFRNSPRQNLQRYGEWPRLWQRVHLIMNRQ